MQTPSDIALLQRWREEGDAHAFRTLTQRYGGLVYGICNRVLKNGADAEEITQECFLKLAQHPQAPARSVGPWLHSVAVRASLNHIRSEQRRRMREAEFEAQRSEPGVFRAVDLVAHVDEAIAELPEALRHCVVGCFLEGKGQVLVAEELGVTTRTVRRRIDEAIEQVRGILAKRGVMASAAVLSAALTGLEAGALPPALGVSLGKIAMGGASKSGMLVNWAVSERAASIGGLLMVKKIAVVLVGAVIVSGALWWVTEIPEKRTPSAERVVGLHEGGQASPADVVAEVPQSLDDTVAEPQPSDGSAEKKSLLLTSLDAIAPIPNPTKYGEVSGQVLDDVGLPIPHATIRLVVAGLSHEGLASVHVAGYPDAAIPVDDDLRERRRNAARDAAFSLPGHQYTANSDGDGRFLLENIRFSGFAQATATAAGYTVGERYLSISAGAPETVNFTLSNAQAILGRVVTPSGDGVADARISTTGIKIISNSSGGGGGGGFSGGGGGVSGGGGGGGGFSGGGGGVSGGGGGGGISGGSGGFSSSGSTMTSSGEGMFGGSPTKTDDEGYFTLALKFGTSAHLRVASPTFGTALFRDVPIGGEELVTLELTSETGSLLGQILPPNDEEGDAYYLHIAGAFPHPTERGPGSDVEGSIIDVATDEEGAFQIDALSTEERFQVSIYNREGRKLALTEFPALMPGESTEWSYRLESPLRVTGHVTGYPSGKAIQGALVSGNPLSPPVGDNADAESTETGSDGSFSLDLFGEPGDYEIVATLEPFMEVKDKGRQQVELHRGAVQNIVLEVPDPWSRAFRLVDPGGRPVPGAAIQLILQDDRGGSYQNNIAGAATDGAGRYVAENLSAEASAHVIFKKAGYIDAASSTRNGTPGATEPEELVTIYGATSATARVIDEAGIPFADATVLCTIRYGTGRSRIREVATDGDGWLVLDGWLPATTVDIDLRLPATPPEGNSMPLSALGTMPQEFRDAMAGEQVRWAAEANTPRAELPGISLELDGENNLGEIVLVSEDAPA